MRYKIPAQYFDRPVDQEAVQFFSAIVGYSTSNFIPAQRDTFRLWQLAFNRTLKFAPKCVPAGDDVVADAELLLYFYSHFTEPHSEHSNVSLLHPPAVFEKLEWALKNVLDERVVGNLLPFARERRANSVFTGMKRWSLVSEVGVHADAIRQAAIKRVLLEN